MNIALAIILSLTQYAFAGITPIASDSEKAIDSNFQELALEVQRQSLKQGGTATQNVKFSSSVVATGNVFLTGTTKANNLNVTGTLTTVAVASVTSVGASFSITASALGVCATASTITVTGTGGPLLISFAGEISGTNAFYALSVLEDGAFISPWDLALGMSSGQSGPGAQPMNGSFTVLTPARSAGLRSYCLTGKAVAASPVIDATRSRWTFGVIEVK